MKSFIAICLIISLNTLAIQAQNQSLYNFETKAEYKNIESNDYASPYAIFGDNTTTLITKHEKTKDYTLIIPLMEEDNNVGTFVLNMKTGVVKIKNLEGHLLYEKMLSNQEKARFLTIDPHAENYYSISPYVYCANNPLRFIDPTGMDWIENSETGDVEWRKNINQDNVPKGYTYIGTEYMGITINKYELSSYETKNGQYTALSVEIGYKDPNTGKQSNYNWVQTVDRDDRAKFVDYDDKSQAGRDNYPYYQDQNENRQSRNANGYDLIYNDRPDEYQRNGYFNAELSLIGDPIGKQMGNKVYSPNGTSYGQNIYSSKVTMTYGFSVRNGSASASPIRVVTPSPFQMQTIGRIK